MQSGPLVAGLEFGSGQRAKLLSKPFILFNLSASLSSSNCLSPLRSGCGLKTSGDGRGGVGDRLVDAEHLVEAGQLEKFADMRAEVGHREFAAAQGKGL